MTSTYNVHLHSSCIHTLYAEVGPVSKGLTALEGSGAGQNPDRGV